MGTPLETDNSRPSIEFFREKAQTYIDETYGIYCTSDVDRFAPRLSQGDATNFQNAFNILQSTIKYAASGEYRDVMDILFAIRRAEDNLQRDEDRILPVETQLALLEELEFRFLYSNVQSVASFQDRFPNKLSFEELIKYYQINSERQHGFTARQEKLRSLLKEFHTIDEKY